MNDEFDNKIQEEIQNIFISESDSETVRNNVRKRIKKRKKISVICRAVIPTFIVSSICLAVSMNIFNFKSVKISDTIIEQAAGNGYIQNLNLDYVKGENIEVAISKILLDDNNLDFVLNYKTNKNIANFDRMMIRDLRVYDENNNILVDEQNMNALCSASGYTKSIEVSNNNYECTFFANSLMFPKAKTINIEFSNIMFTNNSQNIEFDGNWKYEITIDDKMVNRASIEYSFNDEKPNKDYKIESVRLTNTGLVLNISGNSTVLDIIKPVFEIDNVKYEYNNNIFDTIKDNKVIRTYIYNVSKNNAEKEIKLNISYKKENKTIVLNK